MKKRVLFGMLAAAILLGGCGKAETFETVADELDVPVLAQPRTVTVDIPGEAEQGALETASGRLYVTDDYEIILETMDSGDLDATLLELTGRSKDQLTVLETREDGLKRYEFVWATAGEEGDRLGRGIILDDGNYHYCLSVERPADPEKASQVVWTQVFSSFGLEPESSDPY